MSVMLGTRVFIPRQNLHLNLHLKIYIPDVAANLRLWWTHPP